MRPHRISAITLFISCAIVALWPMKSFGQHDHGSHGQDSQMEHGSHAGHKPLSEDEMRKRMMKWIPGAEAKVGQKVDGALTFIDQNGKKVKLKDYMDKPFFITFIFTDCPHICPTIAGNMGKAAAEAKNKYGDKFRMLTISFDTERDDVKRIKDYATNFTTNPKFWTFGVAEKESVNKLTEAFGFSFMPSKDEIWAHITMVTAVNKGGVITKQIYGTKVDPQEFGDTLAAMIKK
ncbi:MAG: SCO family protein [Nitrospinae bacterium]|nr:SCO family protein [Nitrospinota bacterium]